MTTISLRLPDSLHEAVREIVKEEGGSINHFVTLALAEKIAALTTETYLQERAQRGDAAKFRAALTKVPDVQPDQEDQI
ncbi:MAG: toxin-antitoxin system HicB family antitoxin [Chloroflexi bacterium]|nr:toxin-antitoxin system HicB family antitoxin [Chloroflexota bacterium]